MKLSSQCFFLYVLSFVTQVAREREKAKLLCYLKKNGDYRWLYGKSKTQQYILGF
jgi:hypothetical protein